MYVVSICNVTIYNICILEKPYECDICKRKFAQAGQLVVHKRTHTGTRTYRGGGLIHGQSFVLTSNKQVGHKQLSQS